MKGKLSAFERHMKILSVLINGKLVSRLELSRWLDVSDVIINTDIIAIITVVPITSKKADMERSIYWIYLKRIKRICQKT